jgi:NADH:ubiquinone oxidoreductase subunit 6 (subunit J)
MKTPDVTKPVMDKVIRFERKRTALWFRRYRVIISVSGILVLILGLVIVKTLSDQQSFALLLLFHQDPEIIASYWQDTLWVFWQEVPSHMVWISVILLVGIIIGVVVTRRKRKILRSKLQKLANHS